MLHSKHSSFMLSYIANINNIYPQMEFSMDINIQEMTAAEKIKTMELLWDDMCRNMANVESPAWHGDLLAEREEKLQQGHETFQDWAQAKKEIWTSGS